MRINTEQLPSHLTRELKPLYTVYGEETLLALEASDRIRAKVRALGYAERAVLTVDTGFKWSQLAMAGNAQSLFSSRQLLELRIPTGKPGVEGGEALQAYCKALPQDVVTLIFLPTLDWRAQKAAWFDALDRAGVTVEARLVSRKALPRWLAGRLQAQGQEADEETLSFIADRVEGNLMAAYQEVQKLALLFPAGTVTFDQVRDAVLDVARFDVFALGIAMLEGDPLRLARMLEGLRAEGEAPPLILWTMAEEIRAVGKIVAGVANGKPFALLWREARIWQAPHQQAMQRNCARFSSAQVAAALRHAAAIDRIIKGLAKSDVWDELLQLGLRFARSAPASPATKDGRMTAGAAQPERAQTGLF
jgi:DNA polymerase III subunit delta